jgi:hypothetical protein
MKSTEANLENVVFHNVRQMPKEESLKRDRHISAQNPHLKESTIWTRRWQLAGFLAAGYFTFTPLILAHGNSGGHMSGMGSSGNTQHNDHWRYPNPFSDPSYDYHAGIYDPVYSYTPTPEQQARAKEQVESYLLGVNQRRHHAAAHRYISVETLRPTKRQVEDFVRKQPPTRRMEPEKLRCLMVFDTQTREFVGSGCYVVTTAPRTGEVTQFEAVSAEFVGHGKL